MSIKKPAMTTVLDPAFYDPPGSPIPILDASDKQIY